MQSPEQNILEIKKLKTKKNAIILAHYYQTGDIQDIADFVGDSLALSQKAASNSADIICTSSNAVQIVESLPPEEKIIFAPDRNLGNYILNKTGRDMVIWNGTCHVHEEFSLEAIIKLKNENPDAKIIVHPECELPVRLVADFIGSTSALLEFTKKDKGYCYIVATEVGIIHQMKKENPGKTYIPAPATDSTCGCSECSFMKLITIEKILSCLKNEKPEIIIDNNTLLRAKKPILRMMEISEKLGL